MKAEAGLLGASPAARLEVEWVKIPAIVTTYATRYSVIKQRVIFQSKYQFHTLDIVHYLCPPRLAKYIPGAALMAGITVSKAKNIEKELELTVAIPTERTVDVIVKLPLVNISK